MGSKNYLKLHLSFAKPIFAAYHPADDYAFSAHIIDSSI